MCGLAVYGVFFGAIFTTSYYLSIYFQAVRGATPRKCGVYVLPVSLSQMSFATVSGALRMSIFHQNFSEVLVLSSLFVTTNAFPVGRLVYYLLWSIVSSILTALATGPFSMFTITTSTGLWIGCEIIADTGRGCWSINGKP